MEKRNFVNKTITNTVNEQNLFIKSQTFFQKLNVVVFFF